MAKNGKIDANSQIPVSQIQKGFEKLSQTLGSTNVQMLFQDLKSLGIDLTSMDKSLSYSMTQIEQSLAQILGTDAARLISEKIFVDL